VFPVPKDLERVAAEIDGWLELGCPQRAIELLERLLERPDARPAGLEYRVRALVATSKHEQAIEDLSELRQTDVDPVWLDLTEAWCRKRMDDLPSAIQCMEQLLRRDPKSAIGHFNLACYLALTGESERALDAVTVACGIDNNFRDLLTDEPDLHCLHRDQRFLQLLKQRNDETGGLD